MATIGGFEPRPGRVFAIEHPPTDLILQAMRAGANEFFPWLPGGATQASRAMEESFHGAVRRTAARREAATAGARPPCVTHVFLGAKGGAGTTTVAVNCAVELARLTKRPTAILDLKPCLGEVALFLGSARFTVLDAIENLHRSTRSSSTSSCRGTSPVSTYCGLRAVRQTERPGCRSDRRAAPRLSRQYDFIVIDAGNMINSTAVAALYAADTIFLVTNRTPFDPQRAAARRPGAPARAGSERVKILLNRVSDQHLIAPKQIETALGYGIHQRSPATTAPFRPRSTRACRSP